MYQSKQTYLDTLREVPDGIIVAAAGHEFSMVDGDRCICGWVLREAIATMKDIPVSRVKVSTGSNGKSVPRQCADVFGGNGNR